MDSTKRDPGRRHLTPEERQAVLSRYRQSGMTQREFSRRKGVGLSMLIRWLHDAPKPRRRPLEFQEVILPAAASIWAVEVVSPQGWTACPQLDTLQGLCA